MSSSLPRLLAAFLVAAMATFAYWYLTNRPQDAGPDVPGGQLRSVSFAAYREGQSPLLKVYPSFGQIEQDLARLRGRVRGVRTYTSREGMDMLPALARKYGLKVTMGAWLGAEHGDKGAEGHAANRAEIESLVRLANEYPDVIERVIVGNEVLLRRDLRPETLLAYIEEVKGRIRQPVSYADVWAFHIKNPQVTRALDYVTIHILPYWEDEPVAVDTVGTHIERYYRLIQETFPGKPILIGEAGWPTMGRSRGPAVPGVVNSAKFVRTLVDVADKNGFDYNIVEAYDQPWKADLEGTVGAKWGLWSVDRVPAFPLSGPVIEHPDWPWRFVFSVLLAFALVAPFLGRLGGGSAFLVIGLAHAMAVPLVQYGFTAHAAGISFWAKGNFGLLPRLAAVGFASLLLAFAAGVIERAATMFDDRRGGLTRHLGSLYRGFTAMALLLTAAIVLDGRYRDIPVLQFTAPVLGMLGLVALRLTSGRDVLSAAAGWEVFGTRSSRAGWLALSLMMSAAANLVAEGLAIIGEDFTVMHPSLAEQVPLVLRAMVSNASVLLWSVMLLALAVPHVGEALLSRQTNVPARQPA